MTELLRNTQGGPKNIGKMLLVASPTIIISVALVAFNLAAVFEAHSDGDTLRAQMDDGKQHDALIGALQKERMATCDALYAKPYSSSALLLPSYSDCDRCRADMEAARAARWQWRERTDVAMENLEHWQLPPDLRLRMTKTVASLCSNAKECE